MARKIIIDTDPGIDDAMAIFFALQSPELDVVGLTTVFGNAHVDLTTLNALRLLEIAGRADIPVAAGAANPIAVTFPGPSPEVHGHDGQGNVDLPPPTAQPVKETAAEFLVEQIMAHPGEITLVPVAPLTNLGLALRLEPRIAQNVKEVVMMGGAAFVPGNITPAAEANTWNDADAADLVFAAQWPITMIGLDVTHRVMMSRARALSYGEIDTPMAQHVRRILPLYLDFYSKGRKIDGMYVHDSTAISYLLTPELFTTVEYPIMVDTSMGISRGKTWPVTGWATRAANWRSEGRRPVRICIDAQAELLLEHERNAFVNGANAGAAS
jgi:inosine-uridine nucleoside N-ribohydrolase